MLAKYGVLSSEVLFTSVGGNVLLIY